MDNPRRLARLGRAARRLLAAVMASALIATAVLDRDPTSKPRASLFPVALALLDPGLWDCVRNSAMVAVVVAAGSVLVGVPLARIIARWRFWMRRPLAALACATIAVPPLVTALGLRRILGDPALATTPPLEALATGHALGGAWLALAWAGLVRGVPLVVLVAAQAIARIDPRWEDAGRSAGASPRRLWRGLIRPLIRGAVGRGAAAVFGLTLLDPGAPMILDLRRTLGYQLALGITGNEPSRTALLALLGAVLALGAAGLARLLGPDIRVAAPCSHPRPASWRRAAWLVAPLLTWLILASWPLAALLPDLIPTGSASRPDAILGPTARQALRDSCLLGVLVATLGLALAILARSGPNGRRRIATPWGSAASILLVPLAVALASLPIPLVAVVNGGLPSWLGRAARVVDPLTGSGVALTFALLTAWWPALDEAFAAARRRWRPESADAAVSLGASRRRAWLDLAGPLMAPPLARAWVMVAFCAACDASASLLLAPTNRFRPVGPAILALWDEPGAASSALALAAIAATACVLASSVGLASADLQQGPPGREASVGP